MVILWEDGYDVLRHAGQGIGVNTELNAPYVTPDTMRISIKFNQPIGLGVLGNPPYNPFIFVNGDRGREVHLADHAPTDLVDQSFFGTGDDDSKPAQGRYYKTKTNLPWALNMIEHFDYPVEKVEILNAYKHFGEWAESNGVQYPDWYKDKAGYRNSENIYQIPTGSK